LERENDRSRAAINVQDSFFYALRREGKPINVLLVSGKRVTGQLRRFDRYALVIEAHGLEQLVYKHAIASVSLARGDVD
jgi:host factor-I protein